MGLATDAKLKGNEFSWMATAFFTAYALAEGPQGELSVLSNRRHLTIEYRSSSPEISNIQSARLQ